MLDNAYIQIGTKRTARTTNISRKSTLIVDCMENLKSLVEKEYEHLEIERFPSRHPSWNICLHQHSSRRKNGIGIQTTTYKKIMQKDWSSNERWVSKGTTTWPWQREKLSQHVPNKSISGQIWIKKDDHKTK